LETTDKKRQVRYLALFSVILFSASIVIFILILVNQLGYFNVSSAKDNPFFKPKVSILLSDYSYQYYKDKGSYYQEMIDQWHQILKEENVSPKIIKDLDLEKGLTAETDILIMPSSACLSNAQIAAIKKFVSDGGGLIFSWAAGARREGGSWRGWEFVEELANIKIVSIDEKSPLQIDYITLKTDSPVMTGLPSGLRLDIRVDDSEIYARSNSYDAFYSEWRLYPAGAEKGYPPFTAINHSQYGKGKVLWFSFNTNRLLEGANRFVLSRIAYNAINWMMGYPLGSIDNWPGSKKGAFFVDQDTEHEPANARGLAKILSEEGGSATFFCISSLFEKEPAILKTLSPSIEIGSHLDSAETLRGQPFETQLARIKKSKESLERITNKKVVGLKPAEEIYDNNTIRALLELDFLYMVTNPKTPVAVPAVISHDSIPKDIVKLEHILTPPASDFVIMPRLVRDDYLIVSTDKIVDKEKILAIMKTDFLNIYNLGGVYIMPVHTQILSSPQFSDVIRNLIRFAKKYDLWMATGSEIAQWWLSRSKLEHQITGYDQTGFTSTLTSRNSKEIKGIGLTYYIGTGHTDISVEVNLENFTKNSLFDNKTGTLKVNLPLIKPSEKINLKIKTN
jgi:peptidoglycan-N-acetylglucosamine deacetylase